MNDDISRRYLTCVGTVIAQVRKRKSRKLRLARGILRIESWVLPLIRATIFTGREGARPQPGRDKEERLPFIEHLLRARPCVC